MSKNDIVVELKEVSLSSIESVLHQLDEALSNSSRAKKNRRKELERSFCDGVLGELGYKCELAEYSNFIWLPEQSLTLSMAVSAIDMDMFKEKEVRTLMLWLAGHGNVTIEISVC